MFTALQSPIEYQKEKGSSHSLTRNSGSSRPSSTVSISPEKAALSGRNSTPVKLPTSNGSACFELHKHSDKYESSKVIRNLQINLLTHCKMKILVKFLMRFSDFSPAHLDAIQHVKYYQCFWYKNIRSAGNMADPSRTESCFAL